MAFQNQMFDQSGPMYLTALDWKNPDHRRSVVASLVRGVSSLEHDRQQKRQWHQALAPLWGDFFNFKLISSLVDNADHSIFGAIYEFKSPSLETYLFNPPFIGVPVELTTKTEILKCGIRFTTSVMKAGVAVAQHVLRQRPQMDDWFAALSGWTPYLFVHPSDPVSAEYVGYFEHREWMAKIGAGAIERLATRNSISGAYQPLHLLPSAHLIVNASPAQNIKQAQGLEQWWKPNIQCQFKLHEFSDCQFKLHEFSD